MTDRPQLEVIRGSGEIVEFLEAALERVKAGEMDGIVLAMAKKEGGLAWGWAGDIEAPALWSRLVAATGWAHHELLGEGL